MNSVNDINPSRAYIYKFLSDCYYPPQQDNFRRQTGVDIGVQKVYPHLVKYIPRPPKNLDEHILDFSRLYIGPYELISPPYGSIYLENNGQIYGESTIMALKMYQDEGLEIDRNQVPDHIAVELEFMYVLIQKEIKSADGAVGKSFREKQRVFLDRHLGGWISPFAEKVVNNARTDFYKSLAQLTRGFVESDLKWLNG